MARMAGGSRNGQKWQEWQGVPGMEEGSRNGRELINGRGFRRWRRVPGMSAGHRNGVSRSFALPPIFHLVEGIATFVAQAMTPSRYLTAGFIDFVFIDFKAVLLRCTPYPLDPRSCRLARTLGVQVIGPQAAYSPNPISFSWGSEMAEIRIRFFFSGKEQNSCG